MKTLITILFLPFLTACGFHAVKLVGYGKKLDDPVSERCFFEKFEEYQASTNYQLSVKVKKAAEKITYYELTIDGTKTNDAHEVFTPKSFNESKVFMDNIIRECSV